MNTCTHNTDPKETCYQCEWENEKFSRIYYQEIVYDVCNIVDRETGSRIVCGNEKEPTTDLQDTLKRYFEPKKAKPEDIYVLPDTAITEFAQKAATEANVEKTEALLMEFVQEHFQFKADN